MGYQLIETVTVGSGGAASIEFTGINQDGVDLALLISSRGQASQTAIIIRLNSDPSPLNDEIRLEGSGSASFSVSSTNATYIRAYSTGTSQTSNTFSNSSVYVPNYTGSTHKSVSVDSVQENNAAASFQLLNAGLYKSTSAITSVNLSISSGFAEYSSASLYQITAD
jgi:hypothetical protein